MKIFQNNIFGEKQELNSKPEKATKSNNSEPKKFFEFGLKNGTNRQEAETTAMLIHRCIQKKIAYKGLNSRGQKQDFVRTIYNEINIKNGSLDAVSAVRDTLLTFYAKPIIPKIE